MNDVITTSAITAVQVESRSVWSDADQQRWGSWSNLIPSGLRSVAGVNVTPETALTLTAALACINTIATDFAFLPAKIYQRRADGGRDEVRNSALYERLNVSPDNETTPMRSRQALMGHVLGWGNGFYEIETARNGEILGLHLLPPQTKAQRRTQDNRLYYRLPDGGTLPPSRVFHLAGMGFDGLTGYSPVQLMRDAIGLGKAAEQYGAGFYGNSSTPAGFIETTKSLSVEAKKRFREQWETMHRGPENSNRIAILEEGWKFNPTTISPEDAQFLETRKFQVLEVCRIYRVPPNKIGDWSQSHLANVEAANLDYVITVLTPWCESFEQEANLKLLTQDERRAGLYVEHQLAAFLRGDMTARANFYTKMRDLGVYTPNIIGTLENLNPIGPIGDTRLVPANMVNLERASKSIADTEPNTQPASDDSADDSERNHNGYRTSVLANGHAAN